MTSQTFNAEPCGVDGSECQGKQTKLNKLVCFPYTEIYHEDFDKVLPKITPHVNPDTIALMSSHNVVDAQLRDVHTNPLVALRGPQNRTE